MAHEIVRDFHPAVLEALGRLDESIPLKNNKCCQGVDQKYICVDLMNLSGSVVTLAIAGV